MDSPVGELGTEVLFCGEILGLRWKDVDLEAARISVRQDLVSVGYEVVTSSPKPIRPE